MLWCVHHGITLMICFEDVTKDQLQDIANRSNTNLEILLSLGYKKSGKSLQKLSKLLSLLDIDTTHFDNHNSKRRKLTSVFLVYGSCVDNQTIKKRIIRENLIPYSCSECGISDEYNGKYLVLQLEHIDGDPKNNALDNLTFLCPNCHSQTSTFGGRNNRK